VCLVCAVPHLDLVGADERPHAEVNAAPYVALVALSHEYRATGDNYDDPCFWQDPNDARRAFACITSKGRRQVECFDLATGQVAGFARGFAGEANNCSVDSARSELLTTDNGAQAVRVHALPSLRPLRTLPVAVAGDLGGICVAHVDGASLVFVTDEATDRVVALDSTSGETVHDWKHDLVEVEGIACDDEWARVIVCDDHAEEHGCRAYGHAGEPGPAFGSAVLGSDAEGVAIYRCAERQGYVVVSDQGSSEFEVFARDGFEHLCTFSMRRGTDLTHATDGIDILQSRAYPEGLFGACDGCSWTGGDELHLAEWPAIARACGLRVCPME
jgi:myo-inositol-hexaphosphate 3-phosphohydrolase